MGASQFIGYLRHAEYYTTRLVLRQIVGSRLAHGSHPFRPVGSHAGQHDADGIRADMLGHGMHHNINGRAVPLDGLSRLASNLIKSTADGEAYLLEVNTLPGMIRSPEAASLTSMAQS